MKRLFEVLCLFIIVTDSDQNDDKLLSVVTFSRHGQRAPLITYPKDPLNIKWNASPGHLLNEGKMQHYQLGKYLRQHYRDFLPEIYSEKDFLALSNHFDRVLMSATATVAGLYPPKGHQIWNEKLDWQPIPIHIMPEYYAYTVMQDKHCDKHHKKWLNYIHSPAVVNPKSLELFSYLQNKTGVKIDKSLPVNAGVIWDILRVQTEYGYTIPEWTKSVYPGQLDEFMVSIYGSMCFDQEMIRFACGGFYNDLVNNFEYFTDNLQGSNKINSDNALDHVKHKKNGGHLLKMFFGHDANVVNILTATGYYLKDNSNWHLVDYGATIVFELRQIDGKFKVLLFYVKNPKEPSMVQLPIEICFNPYQCDFNEFKSLLSNVIVKNEAEWMKGCHESSELLSSAEAITFNNKLFLIILIALHAHVFL